MDIWYNTSAAYMLTMYNMYHLELLSVFNPLVLRSAFMNECETTSKFNRCNRIL